MHAGLVARSRELAHIDQTLWQARRGRSGAIALRGESGTGKSALIEAAVARAAEFRTVQVRGRASTDAASLSTQWPDPLGELVAVLEGTAPALPRFATGAETEAVAAPSPAAVDAAATSFRRLLTAMPGPLLVTVDDCQVMPPLVVSSMAAATTAQLVDQPVTLILAWRDTPHLEPFELGADDVPEHRLGGLTLAQSRELLASRLDVAPPDAVLAELVGRTGGNPLALVEACSRLTPAQMAGWHPLPDPLPLAGALADAFDVVRHLPPATRRALAVVAAGNASRDAMFAAMKRLGTDPADLVPAIEAGVIYERGPRIDFRHPLVRSVAFHRAPPEVRRAVRAALSDVLAESHAIEASAYHASVDVMVPDDVAARRLAEAAHVALDRGDPAAAARHEELAARCSAQADVAGAQLADAAGHWLCAGERDRARHCVAEAGDLALSPSVAAEVAYHRARLDLTIDEATAARQIADAAHACIGERPHRGLTMLVDAAARLVLAGMPEEAERAAEEAVAVAGAVSSHSEVLARAVRAAAVLARGGDIDEIAERSHVSLLIGQTERFPSSAEVALVIGRALAQQGRRRQADRWVQWIERCAERSGDVTLAAVPPLLEGSLLLVDGHVDEATEAVLEGAEAAEHSGNLALAAWGWQLATHVHAVAGRYELGFSCAAKVFAATDRLGTFARLHVLPSLALLELERGRKHAALAWIRMLEQDLGALGALGAIGTQRGGSPVPPGVRAAETGELSVMVACTLLLARAAGQQGAVAPARARGSGSEIASPEPYRDGPYPSASYGSVSTVGPPAHGASGHGGPGVEPHDASALPGARTWLLGVTAADTHEALDRLASASLACRETPLRQAFVDICWSVRQAEGGRATDAADAAIRLETVEARMRSCGAAGLAALAAAERALLPVASAHGEDVAVRARATAGMAPGVGPVAGAGPGPQAPGVAAPPDWEVTMLGGFTIRHRGKPVALPASLAAQAVKIVALHPRMTVDELIELLWEDAEPGVGARRLRNVLWRIRSVCGDLLVREGNFLRLANGAVTDVGRFRELAEQALVGPDSGTPRAVELARAALECYRGELLPGDRYADWAAAPRESLARTNLRLLDLLVDDAVAGDRQAEALVLLDRLAEVDPYDERHHLRTAEIHLQAGNRGRALDALERAERMFQELQMTPSPAVRELRECLDRS